MKHYQTESLYRDLYTLKGQNNEMMRLRTSPEFKFTFKFKIDLSFIQKFKKIKGKLNGIKFVYRKFLKQMAALE